MLNAFRRHGWLHPPGSRTRPFRSTCSTPFGVMDGFTSRRSSPISLAGRCSTPFGVMDGFTPRPARSAEICVMCSTPFGVMDGFTHLAQRRARAGVQVLNAFRRHGWFHKPTVGDLTAVVVCSTPFGVMDGFTDDRQHSRVVDDACSTPFGVMDGFTKLGQVNRNHRVRRAQRLSASWMVSPSVLRSNLLIKQVLNAFRRHGWFHRHRARARSRD